MKNTDRTLVAIVGGILLLVVVAFVITLTRPKPGYLPEDTPEGVAQNYLLALLERNYARAYGYLSPMLGGYPQTVEQFEYDLDAYTWNCRVLAEDSSGVTVSLQSVNTYPASTVVEMLLSEFRVGGVLDSSEYTYTREITLRSVGEKWKIIDSAICFANCWNDLNRQHCP